MARRNERPAASRNPVFPMKAEVAPNNGKPVIAGQQVDWVRPEVEKKIKQYDLIDDCIEGSVAVKAKRTTYLPMPDATDTSSDNVARYEAYITRAVFYNVSQVTLAGFVGAVFDVDPVIEVPDLLIPVVKNVDGTGITLLQLAQAIEAVILSKGRGGLRIDFPATQGATTRDKLLNGMVSPSIHFYQPQNIINWRTKLVGNKTILSMVVLKEQYEAYDDGFAVETQDQYRVLRLNEAGIFIQEIWKKVNGTLPLGPNETVTPLGADGKPLTEIPFTFIGSVDNSLTVDDPPMFALCDLNIAHYRNSADYEESVYVTGQSTPVVSGLNKDWYENVLQKVIRFGSRGGIPLPEGASAALLQMEERTAAFAAMEHKEKQMVALGAKLVETKQVQRTATETDADNAAEQSVLRTVTDNVSAAITFALEWCGIFTGAITERSDATTVDTEKSAIKFKLNTDFDIATVSSDEANSAVNMWQKEAISYTEMRMKLKQAKYAYQPDNEAQAEIRANRMDDDVDNDGNPIRATAPVVTAGP